MMFVGSLSVKMRENWKGNMYSIWHQCQFSWFCDGLSDEPLDTDTFFESYLIAQDVIMGKYPDITEGQHTIIQLWLNHIGQKH